MNLFYSRASRYVLVAAIEVLIALGGAFIDVSALAQTPAITLAPTISTVAGDGTADSSGDGGPATGSQVNAPYGIALDAAGNLYFSESVGSRIRKIDKAGIISTFAGTGTNCATSTAPCGDGGPATSANFNSPFGIAIDSAGNLYVADYGDHRIRKIDTNGNISTVAGTGTACSPITNLCGDGGQAANANLNNPSGVAVDTSGNIYIADRNTNRIRKVNAISGVISTIAGTGIACTPTTAPCGDGGPATSALLYNPTGLKVDSGGNIYIADLGTSRIRKISTNGTISTVAGSGVGCPLNVINLCGDGGPATSATLNRPGDIEIDSAGNIYIADTFSRRVRKVDITTGIITNVAGLGGSAGYSGDGGPAINAQMGNTFGIALDKTGNLYIAESRNRIRKVSQSSLTGYGNIPLGVVSLRQNIYLTINQPVTITAFNFPPAEGGQTELYYFVDGCLLNTPLPPGTVCTIGTNFMPAYVGKRDAPLIVTTSGNGKFSFGLTATGVAPLVALSPGVISTVAGNGSNTFSGDGAAATSAGIPSAMAVSRDVTGNTYIADSASSRVRRIDPTGIITTVVGNGISGFSGDGGPATGASIKQPLDTTTDAAGNLYIADGADHRVRKVDINGIITTVAGNGILGFSGDGGPATNAQLHFPNGIAVDSVGNLYIADTNNYRIRKVDVNGIISTIAGIGTLGFSGDGGPATSAQFDSPNRVAFDLAGNLYISDPNSQRIRKIDLNGTITTIAGNGTAGFSGDGGPAISAQLNDPYSISLDPAGNLYIVDGTNNRIRKVDINGVITTVVGNGSANFSGDGGAATSATLNTPNGLALDSLGNLFIADTFNYRVRKVSTNTRILTFADTAIGATSALQSVGVSNIGNGELNFAGLVTSPDFFMDSSATCDGVPALAVGNTCTLAIGFKPQQTGARTGTATVTDDALNVPGSTQVVQLNGNGLPVVTTNVLSLSTSNSIDAATPVTLTANVTPFSAGTFTTTGAMSFYDGPAIPANLLGTAPVSALGEASITVPSFTSGSHSLTAVYAGDSNFNSSNSAAISLTVTATPVAVSLISSDNPSAYGQLVRFTATVPSPTAGSIQFMIDGVPLGGPVLLSGTTATFPTSMLEVRATPHVVTAIYLDGLSNPVATSAPLNQNVLPAALTVTPVNASRSYDTPNPDFNYTISGFVTGDTQAVVNGVPSITTTATSGSPVGNYPITASLGTLAATNYAFQFVPATLTVTKATPAAGSVGLTCSPNPSVWGEMVTCTATVPVNATGQVSFMDGAASVGSGTIGDERASFSTMQLAVATHPVTAVYAGDANYNAGSSPVVSQAVNKATLSVTANDQQRLYGQPNPPLTTITSGFVNGDTNTVVTGAPVVTTPATTSSPPGAYPITVAQGTLAAANYNFFAANGVLIVAAAAATVTITSSVPSAPANTPVTFTATVSAGATGIVQFYDGATLIGTGTVSGGTVSITTSALAQGLHSISAVYSGDANFTAASSPVLTETITPPVVIADYNVSSNTPRQLIPPGTSATYNIILSSVSAPFPNPVALTATGLPPGATYAFTPSSAVPGANGTSSSFTVTVPKQTADMQIRGMTPLALALFLLPWMCSRWKISGPPRLLVWTLLSLATLATLAGCGTGGYFSQSEQTYTITVTGTSGSLVRSTTVTLTVE